MDASRSYAAIWDYLTISQQEDLRRAWGFPQGWQPSRERPATRAEQIETLEEIERIMPLPPGFRSLGAWKRAVRGRIARRGT